MVGVWRVLFLFSPRFDKAICMTIILHFIALNHEGHDRDCCASHKDFILFFAMFSDKEWKNEIHTHPNSIKCKSFKLSKVPLLPCFCVNAYFSLFTNVQFGAYAFIFIHVRFAVRFNAFSRVPVWRRVIKSFQYFLPFFLFVLLSNCGTKEICSPTVYARFGVTLGRF